MLPKLKSRHVPEALDEINLFWLRNIEEVQLYLRAWFPGENSYVFTAATYMDYDDKEYLPFLLMGDKHILDDPLSRYAEIQSKMLKGKDAEFLYKQIGVTAEDNLKLLENVGEKILILPLRILNQSNDYNSFYKVGEQAFVSLFNGINSVSDYFSKCESIDDIMQYARGDIGRLVMFSEDDDFIEIQRNDLAQHFNCVPSQINYVISTRFNPSQGYYVESKRGGGGHIKIKKINITKSNYLMHAISSVGNKITSQEVDIFISNFLSEGIVSKTEAKLLKVATSDNVLTISPEIRDNVRANIFKNMLINLVED